ncbi:MAG: GTPase RsgA [Solirubrobacteraceae bacterium]|nr:GTPase RsgA [Solirubrobacteraceae bacterium]
MSYDPSGFGRDLSPSSNDGTLNTPPSSNDGTNSMPSSTDDFSGLGRYPEPTSIDDGWADGARLVRVLAQHSGHWLVGDPRAPDEPWLAVARGRLRDDPLAPPVTGDWVWLDDDGAISGIVPRCGAITRRAAGEATRAQVVAAGVDVALIAEPASSPNPRRAERFAALAAAAGSDVVLVLTKADLDPEADLAAARLARDAGILEGISTSAYTGDGLGLLRSLVPPGATAVLLGPSGAGKSTLANALLGDERQLTGAVRASDDRGRHTTVTRELLRTPWGALLLDTPGVREIGLWDGGSADVFPEIDELAASCRFADCDHHGEPGCAVEPVVPPERLAAWRKLQREQAWVDDRRAARRERKQLGRGHVRLQREARRSKGMPD